jgi:hypothetical protein
MEKLSFILSLSLAACAGEAVAQNRTQSVIEINALKLTDGKNTVQVPNDKATIEFVKRGDRFTDVVLIDVHGHATRLAAKPASTNGMPPSSCKFPIPDACFGIPDSQEVAMCFCKPTNLSAGEYTMTIKRAILTCRKAGSTGDY